MSVLGKRLGAGSTVFFMALIIAFLVFGLTTLRAEAKFHATPPAPIPVSVIEANYDSQATIDELFTGLVNARRESSLGFERGGRIDNIEVDLGDYVTEGQVLAHLDTRALVAQIAAADAQTAEAAAQTDLAQGTQNRQQQLLERGHISQQRLDEVTTTTRAAQARQNAAAAAADALRIQLDLSIITAPFNGVITARMADEGAISSPGQPLLQIIESDSLEIRVGLPPMIASSLVPGQTYRFDVNGRAIYVSFRSSTGVVDRQTRTVTAIFDVDANTAITSGQVVRLVMETPIEADGFWVPISALAESRRGLWSVYVLKAIDHGYVLEARTVETVRIESERVFVRGAVARGEMVLSSGLQRVTPGQNVIPTRLEADAR